MVGYLFTKAWNSVGVLYTCILKSCFRFFFWLWGHRQSPHPRPWSIDRQKGLLCSPLTKCLSSCQEIHLFLPRDTTHVLLGFRCAFIVGVIFFFFRVGASAVQLFAWWRCCTTQRAQITTLLTFLLLNRCNQEYFFQLFFIAFLWFLWGKIVEFILVYT